MLHSFTLVAYFLLTTLAMARAAVNVTIDDTDGTIIYNPSEAWSHEKVNYTLTKNPREKTEQVNPTERGHPKPICANNFLLLHCQFHSDLSS